MKRLEKKKKIKKKKRINKTYLSLDLFNFTLQKRKEFYLYISIALTGNLFIINHIIIFAQHILLSLLINNLLFFLLYDLYKTILYKFFSHAM